jgi:hypothetical protein
MLLDQPCHGQAWYVAGCNSIRDWMEDLPRDGMHGQASLPLRRASPGEPFHFLELALTARREPRPPAHPLVLESVLYLPRRCLLNCAQVA